MKGILFKPDMVQAIVAGRKTVTRRLLNPQPFHFVGTKDIIRWQPRRDVDINMTDHSDLATPFSRYHTGEVVYIKEAWAKVYDDWPLYEEEEQTPFHIEYKMDTGNQYPGNWPADCKDDEACGRWRSPRFLTERFARYFIQITDVRPEMLQAITDIDARREGIPNSAYAINGVTSYKRLWDSINKKTPWDSNPWVWRIQFELVSKPKG